MQLLEVFGRILANLSSLGRSRCISFQRKLEASEPSPFILARLQQFSQSVLTEANSALDLMNSQGLLSGSTMVISFLTSTLFQSAVDMVVTFSGVVSLTYLIVWKKDWGSMEEDGVMVSNHLQGHSLLTIKCGTDYDGISGVLQFP